MESKNEAIIIEGIEISSIEREENTMNWWRSIIFSFKGMRILALSQSTSFSHDPIALIWNNAEIIPAAGYFRTSEQRKALVVTVAHADKLADQWNKERAGQVAFAPPAQERPQ